MKAFWTGSYTDTGKLELVIMPGVTGDLLNVQIAQKKIKREIRPGMATTTINGNVYLTDPIPIPCGHCVGCRMDAAKEWKVRLCDEFKDVPPEELHFVTLTYRDSYLPVTKDGEPYLKKKHLDDFIMELRRPSYGVKVPITFFACGEYGENTKRPHFHIVMRYPLDDLVPYAWQAYHSRTVDRHWRKGITQVKPVEPNLIAYVCGYCEKKQNDPNWDEYPVKPFTSKSKGLGFKVLDRLDESLIVDRKVYGNFGSIHQASVPHAYVRKLENRPWFPEFKAKSIELGKKLGVLNHAVYGTTNEELIGFMLEQSLLEELEEKRNQTL